jgi:hypothetical protein
MTRPAAFNPEIATEVARENPLATQLNRRGLLGRATAATAATILMPLAGPVCAQAGTAPLQINPAEETIRLGPLSVRFLVTGRNSSGSVAAFEMMVPGRQRLMAPAHRRRHLLPRDRHFRQSMETNTGGPVLRAGNQTPLALQYAAEKKVASSK